MKLEIAHLNSVDLTGTDLRRDLPEGFGKAEVSLADMYDWTTLWYDTFVVGRRLAIVCPLLLNLEEHLVKGQLRIDGVPAKLLKIERRLSHTILWFRAPRDIQDIAIDLDGQREVVTSASQTDRAFFQGKNTFVTVQKNNPLVWIRDHLRYHREAHRLEAALIFDNGSTAYSLEELGAAVAESGIERAKIVPVPFRFGARGKNASGAPDWRGQTLQTSLLNIARLRFLSRARAVLQGDIDELVWCKGGASVFDIARRHPLGYAHYPMSWRYTRNIDDRQTRHQDHLWKRSVADPAQPKYCVCPRGPLFWASWDVHQVVPLGIRKRLLSRRAGAWHLRHLSTNWKPFQKRLDQRDDLVWDPEIAAALSKIDFDDVVAPKNERGES